MTKKGDMNENLFCSFCGKNQIISVESPLKSFHFPLKRYKQDQRRQKHLALGQDELSPFPSE
jgi:hypothetical protein